MSVPRAAADLDRTAPTALWAQLRADLLRRLAAGEFRAAFPAELALVAEYGVSRHTVREALRQLRADGTVVAGRGRAPRIAERTEIEQPLGALYSLFASVDDAGLGQRSDVRVLDVRADGVIATRLGLEESAPLVYLERLRVAGDAPLAVDRVWLPAALASPLLAADLRPTSLYSELAARCGVTVNTGEERIRAVLPDRAEARLLELPPGVAAFAIDRLGRADGVPVEWRHTVVRGDRFSVTTDFSAGRGYRVGVRSR